MVSSLKNLCIVPGLVEILNHPHVKKEIFSWPINDFNYKERDNALQRVLFEFLKDYNPVVKLNVPTHLTLFIGIDMWKWAKYVLKYFDLSFKFSESFIQSFLFTSDGLIDEDKAARQLLKVESFSIFLKYNIACQYFLEDIIPGLWKMLPKEPNFKEWLKELDPESPMLMWSEYLKKINSKTTVLYRKILTQCFKEKVFLYGLREKNLAAIKYSYGPKGGSRETKTEVKIIRKIVYKPYCQFVRGILGNYNGSWMYLDMSYLLYTDFLVDRNIIMYFLSLLNKREMKSFFIHFHSSIYFVRWFLVWPFLHKFMDFAHILFENFGKMGYYGIVNEIISLLTDKYTCQSYDYRLFLRDFWIKTPANLKKQIICAESGELDFIQGDCIYLIFWKPDFTADDLSNVILILKSANLIERERILLYQGDEICLYLIKSRNNYRLADLFLKCFNLDPEILQRFKKDFVFKMFRSIMQGKNIKLFEDIYKWAVGSDEIDYFKSEIFHRLTRSNKIEHFFLKLREEIPFSFLNKLLKWFLGTETNIEEWKQNIAYSPLINYQQPEWINQLLKYRGYSCERVTDIKRNLLLGRLSEIARMSLDLNNVTKYLHENIFILCSSKKEKFIEFIEQLRSFYEDSIKQKICLVCLNNNYVHVNGEEQLNCELHETNGFISLEKVDEICSWFLKQVEILLQRQEYMMKWKTI